MIFPRIKTLIPLFSEPACPLKLPLDLGVGEMSHLFPLFLQSRKQRPHNLSDLHQHLLPAFGPCLLSTNLCPLPPSSWLEFLH